MSAQTAVSPAAPALRTTAREHYIPAAVRTGLPLVLVVLGACWLLLGVDFARRGLWSTHEGRAAQHAQVMLDSGRWDLPRLFWGEPDLQKPPLYYWLVAGTALLRGGTVDEFAVRLPSLVAAALLVALVYSLGATWWGRPTGLLAAVALTTMPRFWWLARVGRIDMPLACCVAAAMACFWRALQRPSKAPPARCVGPRGWSLAGFGLLGVGVLLKGPIALVLPAVSLACYAAARQRFPARTCRAALALRWRRLARLGRRLQVGPGLVVTLVLAAPWFVWVGFQTDGELWRKFFVYHNWQRALGGAEALQGRPLWYYLAPLVLDTYPWSLFAAFALVAHRAQKGPNSLPPRGGGLGWGGPVHGGLSPPPQPSPIKGEGAGIGTPDSAARYLGRVPFASGMQRRPVRFCACWALAMLVLFSLVRFKRQDYLVPIYPAMALLAAHYLVRVAGQAVGGTAKAARFALLINASAALAATAAAMLAVMHPSPEQLVEHLDEPSLRLLDAVMSRLRLTPATACAAAVAMAASAALCLVCALRRRLAQAAVATALVLAVAELGVARAVLPAMDSLYNQRAFAARIREIVPRGHEIVYHRMECHDLVFYAGPPARVVVPTKGLRAVLEGPELVYVVLRLRCREECEGLCIGGCLRRRRDEWPDLNLTLLATNRGLGDGGERLALISNSPRQSVVHRADSATRVLTSRSSVRGPGPALAPGRFALSDGYERDSRIREGEAPAEPAQRSFAPPTAGSAGASPASPASPGGRLRESMVSQFLTASRSCQFSDHRDN